MSRPLQGVKVVEVAMWAFVPAAGGMLSDLGCDVIKVEPPTGDPLRGLRIAGMGSGDYDLSWECYNRGKRSVTLDLRQAAGLEVLHRLLEGADVFLTSLLPPARRRMGIDVDELRARHPRLIYAIGSGLGSRGPEADKGGYDSITFWARGGVASAITPDDAPAPVTQPGPAFGDLTSGSMLAGGVAAALARRAMTGEASVVDVSLLAASLWVMQRGVTQATLDGIDRIPRGAGKIGNPLVNNYRTADGRFLALCMLQSQRYWAGLCEAAGRPDLAADPRFATEAARRANMGACVQELAAMFAGRTLAEWRDVLARQDGQWDVVQHVGEMKDDPQVKANGYMQPVAQPGDRSLEVVSSPMQFDGAPSPARRAPDLGADSDAVLAGLGLDEAAILDLRIAGVVL